MIFNVQLLNFFVELVLSTGLWLTTLLEPKYAKNVSLIQNQNVPFSFFSEAKPNNLELA